MSLSAAQKAALNKIKHCRICGFGTRDIGKLGKHYRQKHPNAVRRKAKASKGSGYCSKCGKAL